MDKEKDVLALRREKFKALGQEINLFPNHFQVTHLVRDILALTDDPKTELDENGPVFKVAGRIMAINHFGKSAFIRFRDRSGQLQAYVKKNLVGADAYTLFKQLDIGDFVGLEGPLFKTKTNEWTLLINKLQVVCKSIRPLPEKFHGLKDPEKRFRRRYVDLIMNAHVREIFLNRSRIIQSIRQFLLERDFMEVETPMMQPIPGGAEATPFKTRHNALGMDLFLRIAPELYLKRLVVGGFERVFEINRNFRNEGLSTRHNPEFTMLEFYQSYSTYHDLMDLTETMFCHVSTEVLGSESINYQGIEINFKERWKRLPLFTALEEIGGIDAAILNNREQLLTVADSKGIHISKREQKGKIITKLFDILVEPKLIQPTFITGYPVEVSPLSRKSDTDPEITDRFELFIAGQEIANGFSELNDPVDQKERFLQQVEVRTSGDEEAHQMDQDYIEALEFGMPPTAGEGIGIDRLVMLLTDCASIREVVLFPQMKPKS